MYLKKKSRGPSRPCIDPLRFLRQLTNRPHPRLFSAGQVRIRIQESVNGDGRHFQSPSVRSDGVYIALLKTSATASQAAGPMTSISHANLLPAPSVLPTGERLLALTTGLLQRRPPNRWLGKWGCCMPFNSGIIRIVAWFAGVREKDVRVIHASAFRPPSDLKRSSTNPYCIALHHPLC